MTGLGSLPLDYVIVPFLTPIPTPTQINITYLYFSMEREILITVTESNQSQSFEDGDTNFVDFLLGFVGWSQL